MVSGYRYKHMDSLRSHVTPIVVVVGEPQQPHTSLGAIGIFECSTSRLSGRSATNWSGGLCWSEATSSSCAPVLLLPRRFAFRMRMLLVTPLLFTPLLVLLLRLVAPLLVASNTHTHTPHSIRTIQSSLCIVLQPPLHDKG